MSPYSCSSTGCLQKCTNGFPPFTNSECLSVCQHIHNSLSVCHCVHSTIQHVQYSTSFTGACQCATVCTAQYSMYSTVQYIIHRSVSVCHCVHCTIQHVQYSTSFTAACQCATVCTAQYSMYSTSLLVITCNSSRDRVVRL